MYADGINRRHVITLFQISNLVICAININGSLRERTINPITYCTYLRANSVKSFADVINGSHRQI